MMNKIPCEHVMEVPHTVSMSYEKHLGDVVERSGLNSLLWESLSKLDLSPDDYVLVFMNETYVNIHMVFPSLPPHYVIGKESGDFSLKIPCYVQLNRPIHMVFIQVATKSLASVSRTFRRFIHLGKRSSASLIEHYRGDHYQNPPYLSVHTETEITLKEEAVLDHIRCMEMGGYSSRSDVVIAHQQAKSQWNSRIFTIGKHRIEHRIETHLDGDSSQCQLQGLYLARGQDDIQHRTLIEHIGEQSQSTEYFKGIATDQAHTTFHGSIAIQPTAKGCQAKQGNRNLLLSEEAKMDSVPQLEIHTDDVQCQHGSATGELNEMSLFYLQSRGINQIDARQLLIVAFMEEVLATIPTDHLRQIWRNKIQDYLFKK